MCIASAVRWHVKRCAFYKAHRGSVAGAGGSMGSIFLAHFKPGRRAQAGRLLAQQRIKQSSAPPRAAPDLVPDSTKVSVSAAPWFIAVHQA